MNRTAQSLVLAIAIAFLVASSTPARASTTPSTTGVGAVLTSLGVMEVVTADELGNVVLTSLSGAPTWTPIGGVADGDPDSASWGGGRLDVAVRGTDGAIWHNSREGGSWTGWTSLGGSFSSSPTIVSWAPDRLDVFARGLDGALWANYWAGGAWAGWYSLDGILASEPEVSTRGPDTLDVFARGVDDAIWHRAWNGAGFEEWESLGGQVITGPGAVSVRPDRIDVKAVGVDGQVWEIGWDEWNDSWGLWRPNDEYFRTVLVSSPELAAVGGGWFYSFGRAPDGRVWGQLSISWGGYGWSPIG